MGALAPGPEDAEQQEDGADNLADSTHGPKVSLRPPSSPGAPCRTCPPGGSSRLTAAPRPSASIAGSGWKCRFWEAFALGSVAGAFEVETAPSRSRTHY